MRCKEARRRFVDFYHGSLPPEEAEAVALHLRECARCAEEWGNLEEALQALGSLPLLSAPAELRPSLLSRAQSLSEEKVPSVTAFEPSAPLWRAFLVALGLVAFLAVAGLALRLALVRSKRGSKVAGFTVEAPSPSPRLKETFVGARPVGRLAQPLAPSPERSSPKARALTPSTERPKAPPPPSPITQVRLSPSQIVPDQSLTIKIDFSQPPLWAALWADQPEGLEVVSTNLEEKTLVVEVVPHPEGSWRATLSVVLPEGPFEWCLVLPSPEGGEEVYTAADVAEALASREGKPLLLEGMLAEEAWEEESLPSSVEEFASSLEARVSRAGAGLVIEKVREE